jgi:FkbM family methyltransferase
MMPQIFEADVRDDEDKRNWVRRFEETASRRAVMGTNQWAESVASILKIEYFIDDFTTESSFCDRPVVRAHEASREVMTLATTIGRPLTARDVLRKHVDSQLDYYTFLRFTSLPVKRIAYLADDIYCKSDVVETLQQLRARLCDDVSIETLDRVLMLRRDLNLDAMIVFADTQADQYFESFLRLGGAGTFVDVGAYDGYTTDYVLKKYGPSIQCHVFEPGTQMVRTLNVKYGGISNVHVHPFALSDRKERIRFDENGSSSKVGSGDAFVDGRTLDSFPIDSVDLIKVDIEGAEEKFLDGAIETIKRCNPQIAIACYHTNTQMVNIFRKLSQLMPDSRVFLRHYTEGFAETDMFFVPPRFR